MAVRLTLVVYLSVALRCVLGLQVAPGSDCAALCLDNPESDPFDSDSSSTNASDITCSDSDYTESSKGIKFQNCIQCLQGSRAVSNEEGDTRWLIYNLQYSVNVCLFGYPNTTKTISSPCNINYACQPLKTALETGILNPNKDNEFDYCDADGGRFNGTSIDACVQCLQASDEQEYLANFMTALRAGCKQRPQPGALIGLSGSLFTKGLVNITAPPSNDTATGNDDSMSTSMTTGAVVGIAVGAALLFLGGTALFWVYHQKQKRLYDSNFVSKYDSREGSTSVTPPLRWPPDSKPGSVLSQYELKTQAAYKSHVDYAELEKELPVRSANYHFNPNQVMRGPGSALPVHPAYVPHAMGRAAATEPSPEPPVLVKKKRPDDYALSMYLAASRGADASSIHPSFQVPAAVSLAPEGATATSCTGRNSSKVLVPPPPPGPPPPSTFSRRVSSSLRGLSQSVVPRPPPPPPPPAASLAPKLALPSIPKLRGGKKYQPPQIIVENTSISGPGESVPIGLEISNPLTEHRQRFADATARTGTRTMNPFSVSSQRADAHTYNGRQIGKGNDTTPTSGGQGTVFG